MEESSLPWFSDGAVWRPDGEANPATFGTGLPAFARRRRRKRAVVVDEEIFVDAPVHERPQTATSSPRRRRYARPVIGTMDTEATTRYYVARAAAARAQGHQLEGGVLGPGSFHASCACGAKLSPGELSAITTPCPLRALLPS